jgi:hypothetical protein
LQYARAALAHASSSPVSGFIAILHKAAAAAARPSAGKDRRN